MRERRSASALWPSRSTSRSRGLVRVLVRVFVFVFVVVFVFGGEADSRRAVPGGMFGARGRDRAW